MSRALTRNGVSITPVREAIVLLSADGYTEVLVLLEHGDAQAATARYRRIYAEVRAELESGEAAAQGLEAACPDPLR